jgi:iron-sulfur cluster assembly protein
MKEIIKITDKAATQMDNLLNSRDKPSCGIRVNVKKGGCSGLAYDIQYADEIHPYDIVINKKINDKEISVVIDPKVQLFVIGMEMDYVEEKLKSGFIFRNPNESGRCGCGESFSV